MRVRRRFTRALATGVVGVLAVVGVGWGTASPAGAAAWDPFPDAATMVAAQYGDFLDRAPTPAESSLWVGRLTSGTHGRYHLVEALRATSDNLTYVDPVARLYWTALVRAPDRSGLDFWVGERRSGARTLQQVADVFVTTSDYTAEYGGLTNTQFVNQLYLNVFGWIGASPDVAYWVGRLTGGESRASVIRRFQEEPGSITALRDRVNVSVCVIAMFRRSPTSTDIATYDDYGAYPALLAEIFFNHPDYHYP